ncbi:MAG TPA: PH domain-containing protein [Arachnia sp.]|nr:PH domain-containing protein [Arachnia sp.]
MSETLFAPPDTHWQRLSPNYLRMKLILIPVVWTLMFVAPAVVAFLFGPSWLGWAVVGVWAALLSWRLIRAPRAFRRWGYAERDTDVYLTSGLFYRRLVCVPYGRMQLVQLHSGPIDRLFKLATVEMITSSTQGSVSIPGLAPDDAAALRNRLIERGETQQAGI